MAKKTVDEILHICYEDYLDKTDEDPKKTFEEYANMYVENKIKALQKELAEYEKWSYVKPSKVKILIKHKEEK